MFLFPSYLDRFQRKIWGRKRHLLVDTQGLLMSVKVLEAALGDRQGGCELLVPLIGNLPRLQVIWVDSGYAGDPFKQWCMIYRLWQGDG